MLLFSLLFFLLVSAIGGKLPSWSGFFLRFEMMSAIVYKYGLIAELIGNTKATHQANADKGNSTPNGTKSPIIIIGNQQQKSVATMAVTLAVSLICSFISCERPDRLEVFLTALMISI